MRQRKHDLHHWHCLDHYHDMRRGTDGHRTTLMEYVEPVVLVKDYVPVRVLHQVYIDSWSGKSLIVQTAMIDGEVAEVIGTMTQPSATEEMKQRFWEQFQQECLTRGVRRILGKMPRHLYEHYRTHYGMQEVSTEEDAVLGELIVAERQLGV